MNTYADDGTKNRIANTDTLDASFFSAAVNNVDPSKRYFPTTYLDNVEDVRADAQVESLNSGESSKIQDGVRTFASIAQGASSVYLSKLQGYACVDISAYMVDLGGNLIGKTSADGLFFEPIEINEGTWDAQLVRATDTTKQKVGIKFEWASTESDGDIRQINAADMADADLLALSGLLDVNVAIGNILATSFEATLTLDYGSWAAPQPVKGWVDTDVTLYNDTTVAAVVVATAPESPDGVYTLTFAAQVAAELGTMSGSKTGFEFPDTAFVFV